MDSNKILESLGDRRIDYDVIINCKELKLIHLSFAGNLDNSVLIGNFDLKCKIGHLIELLMEYPAFKYMQVDLIEGFHTGVAIVNFGSIPEMSTVVNELNNRRYRRDKPLFVSTITDCNTLIISGFFNKENENEILLELQKIIKYSCRYELYSDLNSRISKRAFLVVTFTDVISCNKAYIQLQQDDVRVFSRKVTVDFMKQQDPAPLVRKDKLEDPAPLVRKDKLEDPAPLVRKDKLEDPAPLVRKDKLEDPAPLVRKDKVRESSGSHSTEDEEEDCRPKTRSSKKKSRHGHPPAE